MHKAQLSDTQCTEMWCSKFLAVILALALHSGSVQPQACIQREHNLFYTNQVINLSSVNYPDAYAPGSSCRYRIVAPLDHVVVLSCRFELYPDNCGSEFFYISRDGDLQFRDGETYCRAGSLVRSSNFRAISFGYYSAAGFGVRQRGRLQCQAVARQQRCDCGWSLATRIANGQEAGKHEYPAMVALRDMASSQRVFCGGAIVSHRYIVTAAHCMRQHPVANRIVAYAGDHDLSSSSESMFAMQYAIQAIINHPAYTSNDRGDLNDISLLRTVRNIEWSRGIGPICLPFRQAADAFAYVNVDIAGWGTLGFAAAKSNTLQKVTLLSMANSACQSQYNNSLSQSHLCTYDYRGLGQDSCQYDSGGPVMLRQQRMLLIGVISFGRSCGQPYGIGVNTRLTSHLNWLWRYLSGSVCVI